MSSAPTRRWSFVTNHARVMGCVATDPDARIRDIAQAVGITERTAAHIVNDLEQAGYLTKTRDGRRNQYAIDGNNRLRHRRLKGLAAFQVVAVLLEVFDRQRST
ncbi:MAG: winged helix-turn-helix domain-containing protein [Gaiellaceae bacterium]